jgi:hypothetical protein
MKASIKLLQYDFALVISGAGFATMIVILHHALRWCMGTRLCWCWAVFGMGEVVVLAQSNYTGQPLWSP